MNGHIPLPIQGASLYRTPMECPWRVIHEDKKVMVRVCDDLPGQAQVFTNNNPADAAWPRWVPFYDGSSRLLSTILTVWEQIKDRIPQKEINDSNRTDAPGLSRT